MITTESETGSAKAVDRRDIDIDTLNPVVLTSMEELHESGITLEQMHDLCSQVSVGIDEYNLTHPSEMLAKSSDLLFNQFSDGFSVMIFHLQQGVPEFLYYGSIYPTFGKNEEYLLGTQIVELGSSIANEKYRGKGLGTKGLAGRLRLIEKYSERRGYKERGVEMLGMSTVKRTVTGKVFEKLDIHPASYWEFPYISFLTDTCLNVSERFGHEHCKYRRDADQSTAEILKSLFDIIGPSAYIPCTLILTDKNIAGKFDEKMRILHKEWLGSSVEKGDISVPSYQLIAQFYEEAEKRASSQATVNTPVEI